MVLYAHYDPALTFQQIGFNRHYRNPQKNKYVEDSSLKNLFDQYVDGGFRISDVGNFKSLKKEMQKFDNTKFVERFALHKEYREGIVSNMLMMMSPFRYKSGMVTEEEVLSAMNRNGDGGFNEVLNKGDVFIYNYEEFRDYIEHPLFYLFHKLSIWKVSQKCEVRDETKDPRLYQFPQYWLYFCGTSLFLR